MGLKNKKFRAANAELQKLYAGLPKLQCQGLCQASCGSVDEAVSLFEKVVVSGSFEVEDLDLLFTPITPTVRDECTGDACPLLLMNGRCSIHDIRPLICRLWGLVDDPLMICPFGCVPERYLSNDEVRTLWRKLNEISERYSAISHNSQFGSCGESKENP